MLPTGRLVVLLLLLTTSLTACRAAPGEAVPQVDHHQHLVSPTLAMLVNGPPPLLGATQDPITAERLLALLDAAGIERAVVFSEASWFDSPLLPLANARELVRAENDWTAAHAATAPDRLVAFCSFNPLADYAVEELDRCATGGQFRGLTLNFEMSGVDLLDADHVQRVRRVFERANQHAFPIAVHVRGGDPYDARHVQVFLDELVAAAPAAVVQVAHLWGGEAFPADALAALVAAVSSGHPAAKNLWFDVADATRTAGGDSGVLQAIADAIRQIGTDRVLYGSDAALNGRPAPAEAWTQFRSTVPLTAEEFDRVAQNVAPYLRPSR